MSSTSMPVVVTTDRFVEDARAWLAQASADLEAFKALPADASPGEVVDAFDAIGRGLGQAQHAAGLFFQVHPDAAVREQAAELVQEAARFATDLSLDREVYERLSAVDVGQLDDPVARRLVEHGLRDFRRAGVDREESARARVRDLQRELVEIGQEFSKAIVADVRSIHVDAERLAALPDDWRAARPPDEDGRITVTTNPSDYLSVMKYCADADVRREMLSTYLGRAPGNVEVLDRMLARRHELATRLGYPNWAAYVTEDKMIETAEAAEAFIARVEELAAPRYREDVEALRAVAAEDGVDLADADRLFYGERVRERRYGFDTKTVRPYFAYERVKQGVLDTASRLFGISFERVDVPRWHEDVEVYELVEDGEPRARLWLDMHPRDGKYKHAAMFDLVTGQQGRALPEAALVCNFPKPSGDDPALLDPREVKTLFHEFGHLLHHLFAGRQRYLSVSGIATEWDFVEVPSQLFEEWGRDVENLQRFALHVETGEPIPAELVGRMEAAEAFGRGLDTRIQMFYAAVSLELHRAEPGVDTSAVVAALRERFVPDFPFPEGSVFQASFGHLEGYSAIYYTYMWSLVLAKDLFGRFEADVMDTAVAADYRREVLAPGGSRDAAELVERFLGRPSSFDAFESWLTG